MRTLVKAMAAVTAALLGAVTGAGVGAPPAAGAPKTGQPPADFASWIEGEMHSAQIPGASVAVVKNYRVEWAAGFGLADVHTGRKVNTDTPFQIASVSKPIAAIAIIESFFDHGVSLTAPFAPIRFPDGSMWTVPNTYSRPVTAQGLLSHTAGIAAFHYSGLEPGQVLPTLAQELNGQPPATTPPITVATEPGTRWEYAPGGYTMLQAAVEQQNDWRPFERIVDEYVLDKIPGLRNSSFAAPPSAALADRLAVPYLPDGSALPGGARVFTAKASGSMVSTPIDMARIMIAFQEALAGWPSPIPGSVARAMMTRQPARMPDGHCLSTAEPNTAACIAPWGLGFDVNMDATFMDHIPDDRPTGDWFGHSGFNSGYLSFFLASKTGGNGLVVMINAAPADMATSDIPELPFVTEVIKRIANDQNWRN
ncbi:beta-lactamase family protein [Mycobacterium shinjukuense]|uniref:serine hydrolase domain-containing protein n=1 Tax=Mycobacterium shinjukuense TaxID=398694 RepID=UPI001301FD9B|nr:serine hydrolase domain-containing protein [Mycobacterium shinjukuense]MCV6984033.1 beta-lactamase family protein [Mycobacterium shinjukuense]